MNQIKEHNMKRPESGPATLPADSGMRIHFESIYGPEGCLTFQCDRAGRPLVESMSDAEKLSYQFAEATVGEHFHEPQVVRLH